MAYYAELQNEHVESKKGTLFLPPEFWKEDGE